MVNTSPIKTPRNIVLDKLFFSTVTFYKTTITTIDADFGSTEPTLSTGYSIKADVHPITVEDLRFYPHGLYKLGDSRGIFKHQYDYTGYSLEVEPNDRIVLDNVTYEVVEIIDHFHYGEKVFREGRMIRIA